MSNSSIYIETLRKYSGKDDCDSLRDRITKLESKVNELVFIVLKQQELIEELEK